MSVSKNRLKVADTVTGADVVTEARRLIGTKFLAGGLDPATGLDHFGLLAFMARRGGAVDGATLDRLLLSSFDQTDGGAQVLVALRRCVVFRRLAVPVPIDQIQIGDFATFIYPGARSDQGLWMAAEPVVIVTGLSPLTCITVWPDKGLIEAPLDYDLHRAFRFRKCAELNEASIAAEHVMEVHKLMMKATLGKISRLRF
ncbi:MAG: hypothetical protein ACR2HX_19440 [Pyrinomonadaceae bacterium]